MVFTRVVPVSCLNGLLAHVRSKILFSVPVVLSIETNKLALLYARLSGQHWLLILLLLLLSVQSCVSARLQVPYILVSLNCWCPLGWHQSTVVILWLFRRWNHLLQENSFAVVFILFMDSCHWCHQWFSWIRLSCKVVFCTYWQEVIRGFIQLSDTWQVNSQIVRISGNSRTVKRLNVAWNATSCYVPTSHDFLSFLWVQGAVSDLSEFVLGPFFGHCRDFQSDLFGRCLWLWTPAGRATQWHLGDASFKCFFTVSRLLLSSLDVFQCFNLRGP